MSLDTYLTTQPASEQDALTPDDGGCADCGDTPCSCDARCPGCLRRFASKADADTGLCIECQIDQAESGPDFDEAA